MTTRDEVITAPDGQTYDGHLTLPPNGTGPGILLLQEIFGVGDFLLAKARDLAELGFVVLCPDVFWRIERNVALPHDEAALETAFGLIGRWSTEIDDETKAGDLVAALDHLRGLPETSGHQVAVMGYCLGGLLAYVLACNASPDACVSYYGSSIADRLDEANQLTCPTIFHFGGNDPYIPNEQVDAIKSALGNRANVTIVVHEGAGHAFENFLAPQFSVPSAAAESWPMTVEFLKTHLS